MRSLRQVLFAVGLVAAAAVAGRAQSPQSVAPQSSAPQSAAPLVVAPTIPAAQTRYYAIVFAYQNATARPQKTHTWATFVKLQLADEPGARPVVEQHTISWLPADFARTMRLGWFTKCGKNHSLQETLGFAARQCLPVCHWGPYEIDECLYNRALSQIAFLNSGCVAYKLLEPLRRRRAYTHQAGALHCTHAVTDLAGFVVTGTTRGYEAGRVVAGLFSDHIRRRAPDWLLDMVVQARVPDDVGAVYTLPQ